MPDLTKLYRRLLQVYPASFREEYQGPMERQFRDEYQDARHRGERVRLWLRAIQDLAVSAPREILRELRQDLRYALRAYRARPWSAGLAVLALGLAVGAGAAVFTVVNALLLRDLPFAEPERLVEIRSPAVAEGGRVRFDEWRQSSAYLEDAALFSLQEMNLLRDRGAFRVKVAETSANFFALLGTAIARGRGFAPEEDAPGQGGVAVIGHGLWRQAFGGDPRSLGETIRLNGRPFTVIGVAPARFDYPGGTAIWTSTVFDYELTPKRGAFFPQIVGRLKPNVPALQARQWFHEEMRRMEGSRDGRHEGVRISPLRDQLAGRVPQAAFALGGIVFFLWLAAWANVAQWFLARLTERRPELALRTALGASRARLVQQLTIEALMLTAAAIAPALLAAHWTAKIASSAAAPQLVSQHYTLLDWRVLAFTAVLAAGTGFLFGVIPVWIVRRVQPAAQLVGSRTGSPSSAGGRLRTLLVGLQAALAIVLLAGLFSMARTFQGLLDSDMGFRRDNVVTASVSLEGAGLGGAQAEWRYYQEALARLRAVPGVVAAGAAGYLPLAEERYMTLDLKLDSGQQAQAVSVNGVTPGYFEAMGTEFLDGRDFLPDDMRRPERPVIVNGAFAREAGLGRAVIGRRLIPPWGGSYEIVGLVETVRAAGPASAGSPQAYWQVEEEPPPRLTFVARVRGRPERYEAQCQDAIQSVSADVPVYDVKTLEERFQEAIAQPKFYTSATLFFASLAVLLTAIGVYGAASKSVAQRGHEMGVRLALGASRSSVRAMVIRDNLRPIALGLAIGVAVALAWGRSLEHLIESARPLDVPLCAAAAAFLAAVAFAAAWSATNRILRLDPVEALRAE